jgi:GNAT superfamily N-acetyltransferase
MGAGIRVARHDERGIDAASVRWLYDDAGWWPERDLDGIAEVVRSGVSVGAWDGERLIAFARAISDGRYRAYVEDVVVDAAYRGRGVGNLLMEALVTALDGVDIVSLFCEPDRARFYEGHGFKRHATQVMMHREKGR